MSDEHKPTDDIFYNMISIQYHSLKACDVYDKFLADAHDHTEVADFIRQCKQEDEARAIRCHELIKDLAGARKHVNA
ncbi:MAG TPA: hypothetical protein VHL54_06170 [Actinomycetota bacterium]|nr:hypothetical protein [Actinomycetota bacterium]